MKLTDHATEGLREASILPQLASPGAWLWSKEHEQLCRLIDIQQLWGTVTCTIWLPALGRMEQVPQDQLQALDNVDAPHPAQIVYIAAAGLVADSLSHGVVLSPLEAAVTPLPHQIRALERAISPDQIRYLLADEVGLGKTIEAGMILRELKLRGLVRRVLVVAPKGLLTQWVAEMRTHFCEDFHLIVPSDAATYRQSDVRENIWQLQDQVVCSMDSIKPLDRRRGWSQEQIAVHNRDRFEGIITAGWDLIIVDEAHRLGGSTDQVARYKLGQGLAQAAPYLLLLSATPHQGKSDAFHRLIALLDERVFPNVGSINRDRVRPYVIRTEKRRAIDAEGHALFKPRRTQLLPVSWGRHREQEALYESVTEYVREGYNAAIRDKKRHIGFLMILMQRLVTSSTRAIRSTLERRLETLRVPDEQLSLAATFLEEDWEDLDAQDQIEMFVRLRTAFHSEISEVERLVELARTAEARGADAKAEALLEQIYRLQREESDANLKVLIFTEFISTQRMLEEFMMERGFSVVCLNGEMDMDQRRRVQDEFAREVRVLVSTDAGGEGLNLQFCHVVVNYDMPWNPMRVEQRIGRVDRIGQGHVVRALNMVLEDTVEHRVREVLERKLAVILEEFGVDKTGDVLDSAQASELFDDLYVESILHPEAVESRVDIVVEQVREHAEIANGAAHLLGSEEPSQADASAFVDHPLPYWVERMTTSYIAAHGGNCNHQDGAWSLTWPDGCEERDVVFSAREASGLPAANHLTLADERVRRLAIDLPLFVGGQPIARVGITGLPPGVRGFWSLWKVAVQAQGWNQSRIAPMFLHDNGRIFMPTARYIWDQLISGDVEPRGALSGEAAQDAYERMRKAVDVGGEAIYGELLQSHHERLRREREKGQYAFAARRRATEGLGLSSTRLRRLAQLDIEEWTWKRDLATEEKVVPHLECVVIVRVEE